MIDDRYTLGALLGTGATSEVFSATDNKLRRQVAFKRLLSHTADDATVRRSFHREAQALARIRHKNVVAVHDYSGQEEPTLYLVMDKIEGLSLAALIEQRGPIDEPFAWAIAHELANGLQACHAVAVVHRDLKPENVILGKNGRLVLVDFGIARAYDDSGAVAASAGTQVMGTPDFMSPEQVVSNELTGASDVFSLGAVLYFLLTGKRPFAADTMMATFKKLATVDCVPLRQARPAIDPALAQLVSDCMQKEAAARPTDPAIAKRARERLQALGVTSDALLLGMASGGADLAEQLKERDLANTLMRLDQALARNDKAEAQALRRRVLELDPDNTQIFRVAPPAREPTASPTSPTSTVSVTAVEQERTVRLQGTPTPSHLSRIVFGVGLMAAGFAVAWAAVHFGLLR